MHWLAQAPANIALIKYMGKSDEGSNLPDNASISYTLPHLLSTVYLERASLSCDIWEPLATPGSQPYMLAAQGQKRFIAHLDRLKKAFEFSGNFVIRSTNNFPAGSGLASSASSYAALTKCAVTALAELTNQPLPSIEAQAAFSRLGSGSSCRSFYGPWALWEGTQVSAVDLPYKELIHQVVIISHEEKEVPSSEAHQRVKTSPFYPKRAELASLHLKLLLDALRNQDWTSAYTLCWREFQDMHHLFATSKPSFAYQTKASLQVLDVLQDLWKSQGDGPLVTMDAGPNIHLLYRQDQADLANQIRQDYFVGNFDVL